MNPFDLKPKKMESTYENWRELTPKAYDKYETDPYTKTRIILMNGTEYESVKFSHQFSRHCSNNEIRRILAQSRRGEAQQQKKISALKPKDENLLETTISYEQLAVDLTAILAKREANAGIRNQLNFALLEDFDHLYRFSDLLEQDDGETFDLLIGHYTEIMPGRPTIAEHRHPNDDIRYPIDFHTGDMISRLNVNIITAAEQQTMNYYMNIASFYPTDQGRRLFNEIAMIEEQHVSGYESLIDPNCTWLENLLMHEYTECYLYYSCFMDETHPQIKRIWEKAFEDEVAHLHVAAELLQKYEGKHWQQVIPKGEFPELLRFHENKDYIREVLKSVRLTAVKEGYSPVDDLSSNADFFRYQKIVCPDDVKVPSHNFMSLYIEKNGQDMRYEEKPHPIPELRRRDEDNATIARKKNA
ncbi:MAG: hypothetical protein IJY26_02825 [Clostridia bacterium]|nr:hypothetical protein [Clostridia bacterium]